MVQPVKRVKTEYGGSCLLKTGDVRIDRLAFGHTFKKIKKVNMAGGYIAVINNLR